MYHGQYGGENSGGVLGDTWTFNGNSWTQASPAGTPGPLERFAFAYDPTLQATVVIVKDGKEANAR